ncbi:oxidoreductase alpha (molybdopterin) subunit [Verrucomicrobium sp. GAS474]|uniref:FdhF/YdeP family oxidoreductase n=1 Tax=Verrucomicrobium sp. GAS474 TaxID=1882831 RepID=UPI00087D9511|nr:FdhF/YdeP family oxidoreductase [Verrucomicrobium sp. GAS474]SDU15572.1 oxidoreductase alpha (molybdopterin) subunit [Verrucomicrobium sp. GAS474]
MTSKPSDLSRSHPSALTADDAEKVRQDDRCEVAAGIPGVWQTMRFAVGEMGPIRGIGQLLKLNQKDGFDCQSCAWPTPDGERSFAEFCENGAKAVADEGTKKRITAEFFATHSVADLAAQTDHWLNAQGRLTEPMVLRKGATHYAPVSWDDAFGLIGEELRSLASPDEATFYTSGRASNEAAFLYQLFVRSYGTNNLPDCSNMCHESSGFGLRESIGVGKGTVTLDDFNHTDAIFLVGQNPGTNHPRMLTSLATAHEKGTKIVSVNPLPEVGNFRFKNPQHFKDMGHPILAATTLLGKGAQISDLWLPVRLSGDLAVFRGIAKFLLDEEGRKPGSVLAADFIAQKTDGFEAYRKAVEATPWDEICRVSGLTRLQIEEAGRIALNAKRMIICWAMGITQQPEGVAAIQEMVNVLLMGGHIGRPGAGVCPVRGHSNVQGDRTVGIWEQMPESFLARLDKEFGPAGFHAPRHHGFDAVETIKAMHDGRLKVFFGLGGNFLSATPDTEFTARALRNCRLTAHVSTKLNRAHLVTGEVALILPCLGRTEVDLQPSPGSDDPEGKPQFVTVEDSMGVISSSRGTLAPASANLKSEVAIVCGLAKATLKGSLRGRENRIDWDAFQADYGTIRSAIERAVPGFEPYNAQIAAGPFYLPNAARGGKFETPSGKAVFCTHGLPDNSLPEGQFALMTMRSHDQFNTTIYGLDDRYRGIYAGRRVVFLNPDDVREMGLQAGQMVDLTSHFKGVERTATHWMVAPYSIPRRSAAAYFPEANVLVPIESVVKTSNTPTSKFVPVTIRPSSDAEAASSAFVASVAGEVGGR